MSLLLTLNVFHAFFSVSFVDFELVNVPGYMKICRRFLMLKEY